MSSGAIGLIETRGLVAAIEAADAMVKAANVELGGYRTLRNGDVTVMVRGDVGAVQAAVQAGTAAAAGTGDVLAVHVIPRPDSDTERMLAQAIPDPVPANATPPATQGTTQ
jgi:microcompartment protein CcmL/EutN